MWGIDDAAWCRGAAMSVVGAPLPIARRQDFGKVPARFWGDAERLAAVFRSARNGHIRKIPRDRAPLFRIIRAAKHASTGKGSARFPS